MGNRLLGCAAAGIALSLARAVALYGLHTLHWVYVLLRDLVDKPYMPKGAARVQPDVPTAEPIDAIA